MAAENIERKEVVVENNNNNELVDYKNIIKKMIANGAKRINSVRIKNVNFTDKDIYTMVSFKLATPIDGYVLAEDGATYVKGKTSLIFTSLWAIAGVLKEDEELGWMANAIIEHPEALNLLFNGSSVDVVQQDVATGEEYRNPFSSNTDAEPQVFDHDLIINHIIGFKLGKTGLKMADRLADKLLGF